MSSEIKQFFNTFIKTDPHALLLQVRLSFRLNVFLKVNIHTLKLKLSFKLQVFKKKNNLRPSLYINLFWFYYFKQFALHWIHTCFFPLVIMRLCYHRKCFYCKMIKSLKVNSLLSHFCLLYWWSIAHDNGTTNKNVNYGHAIMPLSDITSNDDEEFFQNIEITFVEIFA